MFSLNQIYYLLSLSSQYTFTLSFAITYNVRQAPNNVKAIKTFCVCNTLKHLTRVDWVEIYTQSRRETAHSVCLVDIHTKAITNRQIVWRQKRRDLSRHQTSLKIAQVSFSKFGMFLHSVALWNDVSPANVRCLFSLLVDTIMKIALTLLLLWLCNIFLP